MPDFADILTISRTRNYDLNKEIYRVGVAGDAWQPGMSPLLWGRLMARCHAAVPDLGGDLGGWA